MKIKGFFISTVFCLIEVSYCSTINSDVNVDYLKKYIPKSAQCVDEKSDNKNNHRLTLLVENSFIESNLPKQCRVISRSGNIVSIICPDSLLSSLDKISGVEYIKRSQKIEFQMDSVRILTNTDEVHGTRPSDLPGNFTGKGVLFGIIDADFDIHHPAFLDLNGQTRFIALWDQTDTASSDNRYGFGIIKTGYQLKNDSLAGLSELTTHGTLMTSFAAGSDYSTNYYGIAPEVIIAGVRSSYKDNDIITGLDWLASIADSLKMPCVINLSIGSRLGPHDGTSLIDQKIDNISGAGRVVVGAVGNDYVIAPHTMFTFSEEESKGTWAYPVYEDPLYYSYMDIWGNKGQLISAAVQIVDTHSLSIIYNTDVPVKNKYEFEDMVEWFDSIAGKTDTVSLLVMGEKSNALNGKPHLFILSKSTSSQLFTGVKIKSASGTTHVWNGYRKSLIGFGIKGYKGSDNVYNVNETGGTAKKIITVGAYIGRSFVEAWNGEIVPRGSNTGNLAHFSGSGPTVDGRIKPDITAPGWSVIGAVSRFVEGVEDDEGIVVWPDYPNKYGRYGSNTGTSASSPIVAGIVALMLQADPDLTPEDIREILQKTAINDEFTGKIVKPVNRWGAGKVNASGAMKKLLDIPENISIRKNPGNQKVTMNCIKRMLKIRVPKKGVLSLYDLNGRQIIRKNVNNGDIINLNDTPNGVYTASLDFKNGRLLNKILVH